MYHLVEVTKYSHSPNHYIVLASFDGAEENGIIRPSMTPAVFELRNPNRDIYGKVI